MSEKEQKTVKIKLPKLYNKRLNLVYEEDDGFRPEYAYDHFDGHRDCDYSFLMRGDCVMQVTRSQNVNTFVLPNFKQKGMHMIARGAFEGLNEITLIVPCEQPIAICRNAFNQNASVKLILPKDMALFDVRQKSIGKDGVVTIGFPIIAKRNFKLSDDNFSVTKVDEIDKKLPFKISVDVGKRYDRLARTVEDVAIIEQNFDRGGK